MSGDRRISRWLWKAAVILAAITAPGVQFAAGAQSAPDALTPPRPITREFFGVNGVSFLHYRDSADATATVERRIELIKKIGASTDRGDLWWGVVEPKPGQWEWKATDQLFSFFERSGIGLLPILAYNEAGAVNSPATDAERSRFAEYARRAVARYKDRQAVVGWEVWNEPNIPTFWKPQPKASDYVALLKETYKAVKQADPQTTVVGGAVNMTDVNFLEEMAGLAALDFMDVLSIHPYSMADGPEQMHLQRQLQNYRTVLARHGKADLPIWITEIGWHSHLDKPETITVAAAYLVQTHVIAAAEGVGRLFWFNVQDWEEAGHREAWGFLTPDGKTKRTADAYRTMANLLSGARFEGYLALRGAAVFVFSTAEDRQANPDLRVSGSLAIAWATEDPADGERPQLPVAVAKLELPMTDEMLRKLQPPVITSVFGTPVPAAASHVTLTTEPVYVRLQGGNLFTGLVPHRPERGNLVINGSLDQRDGETTRPYGWNPGLFYGGQNTGHYGITEGNQEDGRTTAARTAGSGAGAGKDMAVTLSDAEHAVWQSWPVPCLPGERYTATARVKGEQATGRSGIQLQFLPVPAGVWPMLRSRRA